MQTRTHRSRLVVGALPLLALLLALATGCSTPDRSNAGGEDVSSGGGGSSKADSQASSTRVTMVTSLSNNPLTSATIAVSKAEAEEAKFNDPKNKLSLEGRISAQRLARKPVGDVVGTAHKLAELEVDQNATKTVSDEVKLELALAAVQSRNFSLAEYFLQELVDSKSARVKAGAFNAMGVVALRDDRVPEAVLYFREALKASPGYRPAELNLGFAALRGGDVGSAKQALGQMQNDWFVQYGLITVGRLEGNEGNAGAMCEQVLKREAGHIAALFNCGLFEYQNRHNTAKAKEYLTRAGKAKGGEPGWAERAFTLIAKIDQEEAESRRKAAERAAAEKAAAAAKQKPPAAAPAAAPAGAPAGAATPAAAPAAAPAQ